MAVSKRARRAWRRSSTPRGDSQEDALFQALHAGALTFLPLPDMVHVLNTSRRLREDTELALLALAHTTMGRHLLRGCVQDWSVVTPLYLCDAAYSHLSSCTCTSMHSVDPSDRRGDVPRLQRALADREPSPHALLTALAAMEARVLPLCFREDAINRYGDVCTACPVFMPLTKVPMPPGTPLRERTRVALNQVLGTGLGDAFTAVPRAFNHVSDFGAHWETTQTTAMAATSPTSSCGFCASARDAIKSYRRQARAALKTLNDALRVRSEQWKADGLDADEIHRRRSELKAELFPEDSYPDVNFADGDDDDILADICESGQFPMNPFVGCAGHGFADRFNDDVFHALREECLTLCQTVATRLHTELHELCAFVGRRVPRAWVPREDPNEAIATANTRVLCELVAGVTHSGVVVGVYIVTRSGDFIA